MTRESYTMSKSPNYFLDISKEICPLTFVRTKLLLERMSPGDVLEVRLAAGEPLDNVPAAAEELGHVVLGRWPEDEASPGSLYRLRIEKR